MSCDLELSFDLILWAAHHLSVGCAVSQKVQIPCLRPVVLSMINLFILLQIPTNLRRHPLTPLNFTGWALSGHLSVSFNLVLEFLKLSLCVHTQVNPCTMRRDIRVPECMCGGQKKVCKVSSLLPSLCGLHRANSGHEDRTASPVPPSHLAGTQFLLFVPPILGLYSPTSPNSVQSLKYYWNLHGCYLRLVCRALAMRLAAYMTPLLGSLTDISCSTPTKLNSWFSFSNYRFLPTQKMLSGHFHLSRSETSLLPLSFLQTPNKTQSHSLRLPNGVQSHLFLPMLMSQGWRQSLWMGQAPLAEYLYITHSHYPKYLY